MVVLSFYSFVTRSNVDFELSLFLFMEINNEPLMVDIAGPDGSFQTRTLCQSLEFVLCCCCWETLPYASVHIYSDMMMDPRENDAT